MYYHRFVYKFGLLRQTGVVIIWLQAAQGLDSLPGTKGWENTTKMGDDKNLVAKPERKTAFLMHLKETTCGSSDSNSIWIPSRKPNPLFLIVR